MSRTITVKGVGKASAKPDYVVLSMILESRNENYDTAMSFAARHIHELGEALTAIGFEKEALKTTNFNVHTDYSNEKDKAGNWKKIFNGYVVTHHLKLEFDFDMKRLSTALNTISGCISHPQLSVAFTVKNPTNIKEEMLQDAAGNAKRKAEILCAASGVTLGSLLNIDYNWSEVNVYSNTRYMRAENCLRGAAMESDEAIDIQPEDINVSDTVTFVWEIV